MRGGAVLTDERQSGPLCTQQIPQLSRDRDHHCLRAFVSCNKSRGSAESGEEAAVFLTEEGLVRWLRNTASAKSRQFSFSPVSVIPRGPSLA